MKDPRLVNVAPNMTVNDEVILSNQLNSEDDPFAEYMWMEHEEEFNRQVRSSSHTCWCSSYKTHLIITPPHGKQVRAQDDIVDYCLTEIKNYNNLNNDLLVLVT